jgi:hypothetical protein
MALSAEGGPGKKWLSEWFTGLSQQESENLIKKFNTSSFVSELGNFDARKKEHLRKLQLPLEKFKKFENEIDNILDK